MVICLPSPSTSLRSLTVQPASFSSTSARRSPSRLLPEPSVLAMVKGSVNKAGGSCALNGSSSFSSSGPGTPVDSLSVPPK